MAKVILSPDQQKASDTFKIFLLDPESRELVIEGHAGTGKSFLTKHLIDTANAYDLLLNATTSGKKTLPVILTATTNKAADVMAQFIGEPCATIHSTLHLKVFNNFQSGATNLKKTTKTAVIQDSLVFIDEAGAADANLIKIIRECTLNCKVVWIGDSYQTTPIFDTSCPIFQQDLLTAKLKDPQRQAKNSPILDLANQLRDTIDTGIFPKFETVGTAISKVSGEEFKQQINSAFQSNPALNQYKIVAWSNRRVMGYNSYVRSLITQSPELQIGEQLVTNNPILCRNKTTAYKTDSIVTVKEIRPEISNEYGVEGRWITLENNVGVFAPLVQDHALAVIKHYQKNKDWPAYFAAKDLFADLRPVYSCTVHKSQGSTYDTVFIDLTDIGKNTKREEVARLLYVAVTRAKSRVVFKGTLPERYTDA